MVTIAIEPPVPSPHRPDVLAAQWAAVHAAASVVAGLAGAAATAAALTAEGCPEAFGRARGWRQTHLSQGLADTAAILEGGIRALLNARAAGAPAGPAAEALWEEFLAARRALIDLAGPA